MTQWNKSRPLTPPFTVHVEEAKAPRDSRTEGPFDTIEEALRVEEAHKARGRLAYTTDAKSRSVVRHVHAPRR